MNSNRSHGPRFLAAANQIRTQTHLHRHPSTSDPTRSQRTTPGINGNDDGRGREDGSGVRMAVGQGDGFLVVIFPFVSSWLPSMSLQPLSFLYRSALSRYHQACHSSGHLSRQAYCTSPASEVCRVTEVGNFPGREDPGSLYAAHATCGHRVCSLELCPTPPFGQLSWG